VQTQPSLPSILQKFIDHDFPPNLQMILLGSSQTMMHGLFLSSWENDLEFDCVRYADRSGQNIVISEIKFRALIDGELETLKKQLETIFNRSKLAKKYKANFEIIDINKGLSRLCLGEVSEGS
jgi:hypothetical protein